MTATMELEVLEQLRYPVGRFEFGKDYSAAEIQQLIKKIEEFPERLKKLATGITKDQLDTPYREGGWTVRQVIHHLYDSHQNAYTRFKLALTEDTPAIKPYDEKAWAELPDARTAAPLISINLIINLHKRWGILLRSMTEEDFDRRFFHPEYNLLLSLKDILGLYAWHGDHHYAHIQSVKGTKTARPKAAKSVILKKAKKRSAE